MEDLSVSLMLFAYPVSVFKFLGNSAKEKETPIWSPVSIEG